MVRVRNTTGDLERDSFMSSRHRTLVYCLATLAKPLTKIAGRVWRARAEQPLNCTTPPGGYENFTRWSAAPYAENSSASTRVSRVRLISGQSRLKSSTSRF